ncbi:MAG TPA: hypothetical protein VN088_01420 [Nocardioides sp.]|nr:hypothetical protein [Nocardioides sp.]
MARDFGPWVRMDWCPHCCTSTEQSRWHSYVAAGSPLNGLKVRCNACLQAVPAGLAEAVSARVEPVAVTAGEASRGRHSL